MLKSNNSDLRTTNVGLASIVQHGCYINYGNLQSPLHWLYTYGISALATKAYDKNCN